MTMIKWTLFIRIVLPILFTFDVISMFPFFIFLNSLSVSCVSFNAALLFLSLK